ncbi:MAG TPA: hypothetical protein VG273_08985 [Bryobacteraceae bacterium]|nr:hypothetical protein [Bryobacteraceae bacterium]
MSRQLIGLGIILAAVIAPLNAQWLNYPEPGTPLTPGGGPNLTGKTPRVSSGKPDLSGVWHMEPLDPAVVKRRRANPGVGSVVGDEGEELSPYFGNIFSGFKRGEEPITPEAAALTRKNAAQRDRLDSPTTKCLPYGLPNRYFHFRPFKIFQTANEIAMFFEVDGAFRQIHTDGRPLPVDPFPSWMGYSTGKWDGDTLVAETTGFNDLSWLDAGGHPHSEALKVTERLHRRDFGHMDVETTVEDPKMLTKPVTIRFTLVLIPNSDILESFCAEGERDAGRVGGAAK